METTILVTFSVIPGEGYFRMDFCAGCLTPRISSSKPGADGREVSNLISCDLAARRKGFMGEYFITPPVNISIEFSVPIDIGHIKLGARLEHMCSTGFSVFTAPEEVTQCHQHSKECDEYPLSTSFESCSPVSLYTSGPSSVHSTSLYSKNASSDFVNRKAQSSENRDDKIDGIQFCVGKYYTQGEDHIYLRNPYYKHWMNISLPAINEGSNGSSIYNGSLRHSNRQALRCVKNVVIKILQTSVKGPPVLCFVEIWGQPGISTGKIERKELLQKWASRKKIEASLPLVPRMYNSDPEESKTETPISETLRIQDSLEIPEDFLDPLTCEVMTVPLLLPSGHSIDAHTLDRFAANEAIWGRTASDPFTGVPFKAGLKPIPNVPLKARIDRFLLLHTNHPEVHRTARTVGSAHSLSSHYNSSQDKSKAQEQNSSSLTYNRKRTVKDKMPDEFEHHKKILRGHNDGAITRDLKDISSVRVDSDVNKVAQGTADTLQAEVEAFLQGKPKYVPTEKSTSNQNICDKQETKKVADNFHSKYHSLVAKSSASKFRSQALNSTAALIKSQTHVSWHGKGMSNGNHGLVQMIGGALSVTHGRTVQTRSIPIHRSSSKLTSLVHGDCKMPHFDLTPLSSAKCSCGKQQALYDLSCHHVMCRTCLLQNTNGPQVQCCVCKKVCKRLDVSKHHEKSIFS